MDSRVNAVTSRVGAFRRHVAWVFTLQFVIVVAVCMLGIYNVAHTAVVITVIVLTTALAWLALRHEWRPVRVLARLVNRWDGELLDPASLRLEQLSTHADADVASLARGLHGFATRLASYNQRERNFTRDASHELRSPLTVIKMSADMLAEEDSLSDFGVRSVLRIKRATREMEVLVDALLILARETDSAADDQYFVVNDALRKELDFARELLAGRPIELLLEEPARFALQGSPQALSVLCWQLIRNACQQTEQGSVVVSVLPGAISVRNRITSQLPGKGSPVRARGADRHGFELAIAQRISDRFAWPLELQTGQGQENIARIRFPHPLPAHAPEQSFMES
ncbi:MULTISPECIES: sensor histidine kinase [Rhodanobacter]|uniref:sensor histidine kinase n=1 Tax=Rhodanobacter TaxID=75309 RepID=UPI00048607B0|nr:MULTISPECIES: HAMP domain-containing sensor histidine kinase [Rhodanobacter]TAN18137.1 MAG: HAMP domain-containing histidine kinase [Rhodanobacter sp.]UJJ55906.1 HAMP domain-containing histidine kinase [Rhodanobacter thiooxydans]